MDQREKIAERDQRIDLLAFSPNGHPEPSSLVLSFWVAPRHARRPGGLFDNDFRRRLNLQINNSAVADSIMNQVCKIFSAARILIAHECRRLSHHLTLSGGG